MPKVYFKKKGEAVNIPPVALRANDALPLKATAETFELDTSALITVECSGKELNIDLSASPWSLEDLRTELGQAAGDEANPLVVHGKSKTGVPPNVSEELAELRLAQQGMWLQFQEAEAARRAMERRFERTITDATNIGYGVQQRMEYGQDHIQGILDCLGPPIKCVRTTVQELAAALPSTLKEAAALELKARAEEQERGKSAQGGTSDSMWLEEAAKVEGKEQEVQLAMGWVVRKLRKLLPEVCWHAIECSVSGISGHGDKIDYGFFKENGKFFTQLLTMVEVKNVFGDSNAMKAEALGQLVARREALFRKQPGRTHVIGAAVAHDSVDIIVMHADGHVWHTDHCSFVMGQVSSGLEWLLRLLLSTPAAMGFRPTVPPVIPALSSGATIHNMRLVDYDSGPPAPEGAADPASAAPAVRPTRVFMATAVSSGGQEDVALKVSSMQQIEKEAENLQMLQNLAGVVSLLDTGVLEGGDAFLVTRPFGSLLEFEDSMDLILDVTQQTAITIGELAALGYVHRDISVGNVMYVRNAERGVEAMLVDLATCRPIQRPDVLSLSERITGFNFFAPCTITGTALFAACSVLRGKRNTVSSDLESLQLLLTFLAVGGVVHWGGLPLDCKDNLARKVHSFAESDFQALILDRCMADMVGCVKSLRDLFYKPTYNGAVTVEMSLEALNSAKDAS
ncbi:g3218 [Coccomyxa elongata]